MTVSILIECKRGFAVSAESDRFKCALDNMVGRYAIKYTVGARNRVTLVACADHHRLPLLSKIVWGLFAVYTEKHGTVQLSDVPSSLRTFVAALLSDEEF